MNENCGLSEEAQDFQVWKSSVSLGKFKFDCEDSLSIAPRDEWKDRDLDQKHIEDMIALVQKTGAMSDRSVWVIDSKEYRKLHKEIGNQMFTKEFCTGKKGDGAKELASQEEFVAWIKTQNRERIVGNHTLECARQLRAQFQTNPVFRSLYAEIWLVDSKIEEDNRKVVYWAGQENIVANSGKVTPALERVWYFHRWLERRGYFTLHKIDELGDIITPRGYFKQMIADMMKTWTAEKSTVTNYLNIARSYGSEWDLVTEIMGKTHGKSSKTETTGCFWWLGSPGVPRNQRIAWFAKFNQKIIDSKELKAAFMGIKQMRALQQSSLDLANDYKFLGNRNWHTWTDLTKALPALNQGIVDTYRSSFKLKRERKKSAKADADGVDAPDNFKTKLIHLFQQQTSINEAKKSSTMIARQV